MKLCVSPGRVLPGEALCVYSAFFSLSFLATKTSTVVRRSLMTAVAREQMLPAACPQLVGQYLFLKGYTKAYEARCLSAGMEALLPKTSCSICCMRANTATVSSRRPYARLVLLRPSPTTAPPLRQRSERRDGPYTSCACMWATWAHSSLRAWPAAAVPVKHLVLSLPRSFPSLFAQAATSLVRQGRPLDAVQLVSRTAPSVVLPASPVLFELFALEFTLILARGDPHVRPHTAAQPAAMQRLQL